MRKELAGILRTESGQTLMIGVLTLLILIIAVPTLVFINQSSSRGGKSVEKNQNASATVQEGVAYAMHVLSGNPATWTAALQDAAPAEFAAGEPLKSGATGGIFSIRLGHTTP